MADPHHGDPGATVRAKWGRLRPRQAYPGARMLTARYRDRTNSSSRPAGEPPPETGRADLTGPGTTQNPTARGITDADPAGTG